MRQSRRPVGDYGAVGNGRPFLRPGLYAQCVEGVVATARRTERVLLRFSPGELAALEAVRGLRGGAHSQADVVARLLRSECIGNLRDPACAAALRLLEAEAQEPQTKAGRPATAPRRAQEMVRTTPPRPDPVRPGARFEHRDWRWGGKVDGPPMVCQVVEATQDDVSFRRLRRDGGLVKEVHRQQRGLFERVCVGRWVEAGRP